MGGDGAGNDEAEGEEVAEAAAEETEGGDEKERDEGESAGADAGELTSELMRMVQAMTSAP